MIDSGCPNCGGSLFSEGYKAEGRFFIEHTCINCARQWTPQNQHEIVEAFIVRGQLDKAKRVNDELNKAVKKETPKRPTTTIEAGWT